MKSIQFKTACWFIPAVFLVFDRFFKSISFSYKKDIVSNWLKFNFTPNYYISFSLPFSGPILIFIIVILIFVLIFFLIISLKKGEFWQSILLITITFGAASNLFDRLKYGYVIDYFDLKYFTVFNIADIMIVSATFLLLLSQFNQKTFKLPK